MHRPVVLAAAAVLGIAAAAAQPAPKPTITVGLLTDVNGPFAAVTGPSDVAAAEMAVADGKALLPNREIKLLSSDYQNKPEVASALARKWIDQDGADVIVDIPNSAAALAVADVAKEKDRLYLATAAGTTELTGRHCLPTTIHGTDDNYMQVAAVVPRLVKEGGKRWFFVTPDYAYGHDAQAVASSLLKQDGGTVVGSVLHPVPMADFSSYLLAAASSDAQVIGLISGGSDAVNAVKQSQEFGLTESGRRLVTFLTPINTVRSIGLEAGQGLYVTESFYWNLDDGTRAWAERFRAKTGVEPNMAQAGVYSALIQYFRTLAGMPENQVKSGQAAAAAMKATPFDDPLFGRGYVRADGRYVHDTLLLQVKKPSESKDPWDVFNLVERVPGEQVADAMRPECQFKASQP